MGEREITAKSDVYALGLRAYEMLTGEPPFTGPTAQAIIARVMTEEPRSLTIQRKTMPPHVEAAVVTALSKLPADRFATAALFGEALSRPGATTVVTPAARRGAAPAATERRARARCALAPGSRGPPRARRAPRGPGASDPRASGTTWQYIAFGDGLAPTHRTRRWRCRPTASSLAYRDNVPERADLAQAPRRAPRRRRIPGTERAQPPGLLARRPVDRRSADGRIRKIRPGEGGAVTLADSADAHARRRGWLDDGTLVYVGPALSELSRVSAAGGASTVVSRTRAGGLRDRRALGAPRRPRACCSRSAPPAA